MKRAVIRLPAEVLGRLDELARELNLASPGRRFSRAAVARILLSTGLSVVDVEGARFGGVRIEGRLRQGTRCGKTSG